MIRTADEQSIVVRTGRGLCIAETRITLYTILDYLNAGWSPELLREWLGLTAAQLDAALKYINEHRDEVERDYSQVIKQADENRRYWEKKHQNLGSGKAGDDQIKQDPRWEKLQAWKDRVERP